MNSQRMPIDRVRMHLPAIPARLSTVVWGVAVASALVLLPCVAEACPNCKDSLAESDPASLGIVQGFFWSIMLMLSMPALILGGLCTYFYVLVRHARRGAAAGAAMLAGEANGEGIPPTQALTPSAPHRNSLPTWEEVMAREQAREQAGV